MWEDNVRKVMPYTPGEQPRDKERIIKLNTNECPYPPAPGVSRALAGFDCDSLRLYPDPKVSGLNEAISDMLGVDADMVFTGVGSDDVLAMSFMTFFNSDKPILFPDITYSFYDVWAELFRIPYKRQPLNDSFLMEREDYEKENGGIIFPNPNAPTGILQPLSFVEEVLKANPGSVVIVDEAYIDFAPPGSSAVSLLDKYDNLLVVQTFSKSRAMAGARIGFAVGSPGMIKYLNDVKFSYNSYTMSRPVIAAGVAAVRDKEYFAATRDRIVATRGRLTEGLEKMGFTCLPSSANFVFARHERVSGDDIFRSLRERNIYVRHWDSARIADYNRITVGTDGETDELLKALSEIVG